MSLLHSSLGRYFFIKIMIFWYPPNISIFYKYATMMMLFQGISWMHILSHFIAWVGLLFLTLFMIIFWPELFQEPRYLLWFILINWINCGASQSTNVLMVFFFFAMGHLVGLSPKIYEIPLPQVEITYICFTYNILHNIK